MKTFLIIFSALALLSGVYFLGRWRGVSSRHEEELPMSPPDPGPEHTAESDSRFDQFLYDRCCRYMAEKRPFLVESFSLGDLASALYTNKVYLSKTINFYSGKNFRKFINHYRVMYAMDIFRNDMKLQVNELAGLSGFRSTTTFAHAFFDIMEEPPSTWCARMRVGKKTK